MRFQLVQPATERQPAKVTGLDSMPAAHRLMGRLKRPATLYYVDLAGIRYECGHVWRNEGRWTWATVSPEDVMP